MKKDLTPKYADVYSYILKHIKNNNLKKGDKLPTEKQLAQDCNVSRITIQRAIKELQQNGIIYRIQGGGTYVDNNGNSKQNKFNFLPLIISHDEQSTRGFEIIQGVGHYLNEKSYYLTVHTSNNNSNIERTIIQRLVDEGITCIMVMPSERNQNKDLFFDLIQKGISFIFIDRIPKDLPCNLVESDNITGGFLATEHLILQGHSKIALLSPFPIALNSSINERLSGYRLALSKYNVPLIEDYIVLCDDEAFIKSRVTQLMSLPEPPSAIFAINDLTAINVLHTLQSLRFDVPNDVAIIGFDNLDLVSKQYPPISSVEQPFFNIGYHAAKIAFDIINCVQDGYIHVMLPVSLKPRMSTNTSK